MRFHNSREGDASVFLWNELLREVDIHQDYVASQSPISRIRS